MWIVLLSNQYWMARLTGVGVWVGQEVAKKINGNTNKQNKIVSECVDYNIYSIDKENGAFVARQ